MIHEQRGPSPECHPEPTAHTEIINNNTSDGTGAASPVQAFFSAPPEPASMLDWALAYARCGWAVFPVHTPDARGKCSCRNVECDRVGKHPRTPHGFKDATTDEDVIRAWWTGCPDANIGVATGSTSGVDVFDIENEQKGGVATLAELEREHGGLPVTPRAISGSGGRHDYFATRGDAPMASRVRFAAGLDTRGAGGYIVAPPSRHESGGTYSWAPGLGPDHIPLQPAPDWLIKLVQEHVEGAKASKSSTKTKDKDGTATSTKPVLDVDLVVKGVPEGQRQDQLFREACRLRALGVSREEAEVTILGFAQRCSPPFPEADALARVRSAFKYTVDAAKDPDAIQQAREIAADIIKRAKTDNGAPFEPEARQALSLIRAVDQPTWARTQQALRKAGVKLRALDDSLADPEDDDGSSGTRSQADRLLDVAETAMLFHTPDLDCYARVEINRHWETWNLQSSNFKVWLRRAFYQAEGRTPAAQAVTDALSMLTGRALDGPRLPVFTRLAEHEGSIFVDLTNDAWEAVEVSKTGWRVVSDVPVMFRRARGVLALPHPTPGGSLDDLYRAGRVGRVVPDPG